MEDKAGEKKWQKSIWKLKYPLKTRTFLWLELSYKILTNVSPSFQDRGVWEWGGARG